MATARSGAWRRISCVLVAFAACITAEDTADDCWNECKVTGLYCIEFCCEPLDGIGNPSCWDFHGHFSYTRCCGDLAPPCLDEPPLLQLGSVLLPLYRGPSDHNSPKTNERTLEIALGFWFLRRHLRHSRLFGGDSDQQVVEVGNVMAQYWPTSERMPSGHIPWHIADLVDTGVDASTMSFANLAVLSLSTVEHIGYDNEGSARTEGHRTKTTSDSFEGWVRDWDQGAQFLRRVVRESPHFLVSFPIGFNLRLDEVVRTDPELSKFSTVVRRIDAANRWEVDQGKSYEYRYDYRDTYAADAVGHMYDPLLPEAYKSIYGSEMPHVRPIPWHPKFRFANAVCVLTNHPELLT